MREMYYISLYFEINVRYLYKYFIYGIIIFFSRRLSFLCFFFFCYYECVCSLRYFIYCYYCLPLAMLTAECHKMYSNGATSSSHFIQSTIQVCRMYIVRCVRSSNKSHSSSNNNNNRKIFFMAHYTETGFFFLHFILFRVLLYSHWRYVRIAILFIGIYYLFFCFLAFFLFRFSVFVLGNHVCAVTYIYSISSHIIIILL